MMGMFARPFALASLFLAWVQDGSEPQRLLPLEARNEWTFDSKEAGPATIKVLRKKSYKSDAYWIVEFKTRTFKETRHLKVDAGGIKQHFLEISTPERVLQIPADDPVYEMVFPPERDRSWELRLMDGKVLVRRIHRILEPARIEVPAGTFQCVGVELSITRDDKPSERAVTWFASDVGYVKLVREKLGPDGKAVESISFDLRSHKVKPPAGPQAEGPPDPVELEAETRKVLRRILEEAASHQDPETHQLAASFLTTALGEETRPIDKDATGTDAPAEVRRALQAAEQALAKPYQALAAANKDVDSAVRGMFLARISQHVAAVKRLNFHRRAAGLAPVAWDWSISRGAMLHARYLAHTGYANAREAMDLHAEDPKSPYYTPEGAKAGPASVVAAWELDKSVDEWMVTFYHRVLMLKPHLKRIGTGMWTEGIDLATPSVIDTSSGVDGSPQSEPVAYPGPGQKEVEPRFTKMGELPRPMPGQDEKAFGNPVTLTFYGSTPSKVSARLLLGDREVDCFLSSADRPSNPAAPYPNTICLMPKAALRSRATYTVRISCEASGQVFSKEWAFTTR
jgi:uncharacterized protein YkwD